MTEPTNHPSPSLPDVSPAPKPPSVTTVASIALAMGALGTLCCGLRGLLIAGTVLANGGSVPASDGTTFQVDPLVVQLDVIFGALDVVTSGTLLLCGIGALSLKPWARRIGIAVSIVIVLLAAGKFVTTVAYSGPRTEALMDQLEEARARQQKKTPATNPAAEGPPLEKFFNPKTIAVGALLMLLQMIAPILILIFWNKPVARQAFAGSHPVSLR